MKFCIFNNYDVGDNHLYAQLEQMNSFADNENINYSTFVEYTKICDWAIRRQEYNFIIDQVDSYAAKLGRQLNILDIGCGVVPLCNKFSNSGHKVIACDPIKADIDFLISNNMNNIYDSSVEYLVANAENLPFESNSFDVVYMASVLEHIPTGNDELALIEAGRVLKKGGLLVLTTDIEPVGADNRRHYMRAFTARNISGITEIMQKISGQKSEILCDGIEQLEKLTWDEVYDFWSKTSSTDKREEGIRHYLAIGMSCVKYDTVEMATDLKIEKLIFSVQNLIDDYCKITDGLSAKEHMIQQKEEALQELSRSLVEKEAVIQELDTYIKQNIKGKK